MAGGCIEVRPSRHMTRDVYAIRWGRERDAELLPHVERAALQRFRATAYPQLARDSPCAVEQYRSWILDRGVLVAAAPGDVAVGFAVLIAIDGDMCVHELAVHPAWGRRGIGRSLLAAACRVAEDRGHVRIVLSTFVDVPWNAPFYRRIGFHDLDCGHVGNGLREMRRRESLAGLDVARRTLMARQAAGAIDPFTRCGNPPAHADRIEDISTGSAPVELDPLSNHGFNTPQRETKNDAR